MKTSAQMAQEYIDEYPKIERANNEYFIKFFSGNNGKSIKGKECKFLNYYMDLAYLDTMFIDSKEKDFWDKFNSSTEHKVYMWGSSILFDFNENFYYELPGLHEKFENNQSLIVKNKRLKIAKLDFDLSIVEDMFESDIIIL